MSKLFLYKCVKDGEFEYLHHPSITEDPATCPTCASKKVKRLFAPKVSHMINGASARNNYGLKPEKRK